MVDHEQCPRCGGQLIGWNEAEVSCLQCGHVPHQSVQTALGLELPEGDQKPSPAPTIAPTGKPK